MVFLPLLCAALGCLSLFSQAFAFDLETLAEKAKKLAAEPFSGPQDPVPKWLLEITYDQWRDIRFRPDRALWRERKLPFEVQFFHPGLYYDRAVKINVVDAEGSHPVAFSPSLFDYGKNSFASQVPQDLGFAGFRLHYPINRPDYLDEVIVFLGASYFRAVPKNLSFGISARGLAIDTAEPSGEEFPYFRKFWLVRPTSRAKEIAVFALLDSPRLTGAYRFVVYPGVQTVVDVDAKVFLREEVSKLGIAPLTTMFFFGENSVRTVEDYRSEVHDSDGLLLAASTGEWIWRPLDNPKRLRVSAFELPDPKGFGLLQRDRDFDHYQDLEARPEKRPSVWIEPRGEGWGKGRVELVEIPTHRDINDNIVAFWIFEDEPKPNEPFSFSYRMYWYGDDPMRPPGGRALATRRDRGTFENAYRFVVDFGGGRLEAIPGDTVLRGVVTVTSATGGSGEIVDQQVTKNPVTGGWRLTFQVRPAGSEPLELRAFLQLGQEALTETWAYQLEP